MDVFVFYFYREAIAFLAMAILSFIGLAHSVADDESCDASQDGCEDWNVK